MYLMLIVNVFNVNCVFIKTTIVGMNPEEFDNISLYLSSNVYPIHILESKNSSHVKNFRARADQFQNGENGKIFKVNLFNKMVISAFVGTIYYR